MTTRELQTLSDIAESHNLAELQAAITNSPKLEGILLLSALAHSWVLESAATTTTMGWVN